MVRLPPAYVSIGAREAEVHAGGVSDMVVSVGLRTLDLNQVRRDSAGAGIIKPILADPKTTIRDTGKKIPPRRRKLRNP
jgi:hypothetical protein